MLAWIARLLVSLGGAMSGGFAQLFTIEAAKWVAQKAFTIFIVCVVLPIVLYNVFAGLMFDIIKWGIEYIGAQPIEPVTIQLTGIAGWIAQVIDLPSMLSMVLTAVCVRFVMGITRVF